MDFSSDTLDAARKAGYSDQEILDHLGAADSQITKAHAAGYSLEDIAGHFDQQRDIAAVLPGVQQKISGTRPLAPQGLQGQSALTGQPVSGAADKGVPGNSDVSEDLTKPVVTLPPQVGQVIGKGVQIMSAGSGIPIDSRTSENIGQGISKVAEGMTGPANVAMLAAGTITGGLSPLAAKALGLGFLAYTASQNPKQIEAAITEPDPDKRTQQLTQLGVNNVFAALGGLHAAHPEVLEDIGAKADALEKSGNPETAKAYAKTEVAKAVDSVTPKIISTALLHEDGRIATNVQDPTASHASLIQQTAEGGHDFTEAQHGFLVPDGQGGQRFAGRIEAADIAHKSGQITPEQMETALGRTDQPGLHSEDLQQTKKAGDTIEKANAQTEEKGNQKGVLTPQTGEGASAPESQPQPKVPNERSATPAEPADASSTPKPAEAQPSAEPRTTEPEASRAREASEVSGQVPAESPVTGSQRPNDAGTAEFQPQQTTGLKKAIVKDERLKRGLDDLPPAERQEEESRIQRAKEAADKDPEAAKRLVTRVVDGGDHAISADDAATLLVERNRVMNQRRALESEREDPETSTARKAEIDNQIDGKGGIEEQTDRLDRAQRAAGSNWGRTGRMYQRLIREDYTLEAMEGRMRRAKNGPLTPDERAKVKDLSDRITDLTKRVEASKELESQLAQAREVTRTHEATIQDLKDQASKAPKYGKEVFDIAHGIVKRWKVEAETAHQSLRERLSRTSAGIDPTILVDVAKIMRAHVGEFGLNAAESGTRLIAEYGETIRPYLAKAWTKAQDLINGEKTNTSAVKDVLKRGEKKTNPEAAPIDIKARAKAEATTGEELSHKTVYDLARAHINAGVHGEDAVMAAVHRDIAEAYPNATERNVRQAFSEYGKAKFPSKEADKVELSELRNLTRMQESIDRLKEGQDAMKTGLQRDKATQAIRDKQKQLNELLKARQGPPSPEKLATNMEARKTALRNQIQDLHRKLQTGEKPPAGTPPPPLDADGERLTAESDAMKAKLKEIEDAEKPPGPTKEEQYNAQRQKAIAKEMSDVQQRIASGNYGKPPKIPTPEKTPETIRAWTDLQKAKAEEKHLIEQARIANQSPAQDAVYKSKQLYHTVTAAKIAGHGTVGMVTHAGGLIFRPSVANVYWRNFGRQFGMWANPAFHERLIYNLENDPEFHTWKEAGASIDPQKTYTDYGMYAKWLGKAAAGGQRGFDALKLARLELNKQQWEGVPDDIKNDPQAAMETRKQIAAMNNKATGAQARGNDILNEAARSKLANSVLFAPKLYASRWSRIVLDPVKTLGTVIDWNNATQAEKYAAITKAKHAGEFAAAYIGALVTNQAILSATGSNQKVNITDPSKSDWLKFKGAGSTITADGGLLDPVRLIGQIVSYSLEQDNKRDIFKQGTDQDKIREDLAKYVQGKLNPPVALAAEVITQRDFAGRPLPWSSKAPKYKDQEKYSWGEWLGSQGPIPLASGIEAVYDGLRKNGLNHAQAKDILVGAATAMAGMTGVHAQEDYHPKPTDTPRRKYSIRRALKKDTENE